MSQGKKSFIAYSDWKEIFDELPNEDAGALVKHIFAYVNDENPVSDSVLIRAVFANIKATLKRDLEKWDSQIQQRVEAGKQSALKRASTKANEIPTVVEDRERNPTDSVIVIVSDTDSEKKKPIIFNFKKSLLDLGISESVASDWLAVRIKKKATNTETAFNSIKREILKSSLSPDESIRVAVEKSWSGFEAEWILNLQKQKTPTKTLDGKPKLAC